jgi:hypothetical protein
VHSQLDVSLASLREPESRVLMKLPARYHVRLRCLADMAIMRVRCRRALHCVALSIVLLAWEGCEGWDALCWLNGGRGCVG